MDTHTFPLIWQNVGYKMNRLDLRGQKVSFAKIGDNTENNKSCEDINISNIMSTPRMTAVDIDLFITKGDFSKLN